MNDETEITITQDVDEYLISEIQENPDYYRVVLKLSLYNFIKVFHYYLYRQQFQFKDFHLKIIAALESEVYGEPSNLVITMPPRYGKSSIVKNFLAWSIAINPMSNNIYTSYSNELVQKFSGEIRDLINSPLYRKLFCFKISDSSSSKSLWEIAGGGSFRAASLASPITGFGAGVLGDEYGGAIVIDDMLKASDARSEAELRNCIDYYVNTLKSRKNNRRTPIICTMQRLSIGDLVAYLEEHERDDYKFLVFRALENGQSIWPEKYDTEDLLRMQEMNPRYFQTQYMQRPSADGGELFHIEKFLRYRAEDLSSISFQYTKVFCDLAATAKTSSDYSVFLHAGFTKDGRVYILNLWRVKLEVPEVIKLAYTIHEKLRKGSLPAPRSFAIEHQSTGIGLIQEFRRSGILVESVLPKSRDVNGKEFTADKVTRAYDVLPEIEAGNVYIPAQAPWLDDFLNEVSEFAPDGSAKHDDIVDTLIYCIKDKAKPRVRSSF